jgi:8-oxo-dGTP pyrophosphatase MutT (NUDIX family)
MAMAADFLVNPTTLASSASKQLRSLTLGGQLTDAALRSIADPTEPPYEEITKARLNQHAIPLLRAAMSDNPAPTDRLAARLMAGPIDTRLRDEALKRGKPLAEKVDKERLRRHHEASAVARDALKRIDDVPSAGKAVQTAAGLANVADLLANNPFAPKTGPVPYLLRGPLKRDNRDRLQQAVTPYAEQADRAVRDIQTTGNDAVTAANAKINAVPRAAPTFKDRLITPFDDRVGTTASGGKTNNPADIPAPVQPFRPGRILKSVADRGMDKGGAAKPYRRRVEVFALDADGKVFGSAYPDGGFGGYGGGIDAGETVAAAAAREFLEETGRTIEGVRRLAVPSVRIDWGPDDAGGSAEKKRRREEYRGSETVYVTAELGPPDPDADKERDPHNRPAGKTVSLAAALATLTPGDEGDGIEAANAGRRAAVELLKTERQAPPLAVLKMAAAFRPCPVASLLSLFQGLPVG